MLLGVSWIHTKCALILYLRGFYLGFLALTCPTYTHISLFIDAPKLNSYNRVKIHQLQLFTMTLLNSLSRIIQKNLRKKCETGTSGLKNLPFAYLVTRLLFEISRRAMAKLIQFLELFLYDNFWSVLRKRENGALLSSWAPLQLCARIWKIAARFSVFILYMKRY